MKKSFIRCCVSAERVFHILCVCLTAVALSFNSLSMAAVEKDWQNLDIISRGKMPARASGPSYSTIEDALYSKNPRRISLNGSWKFLYQPNAKRRFTRFANLDYDASKWRDITVPSSVEMQGNGRPIYSKDQNPLHPNLAAALSLSPAVDNPISYFIKEFRLPSSFAGQRVLLNFEGVSSAFYVWVNGEMAGYSQGSSLPAEFDVSDLVKSGKNKVAVQVFRWSDGSYLENHDGWRLSGIFRDVSLHAEPKIAIRDFFAKNTVSQDKKSAVLTITPELSLLDKSALSGWQLKAQLFLDGKAVPDQSVEIQAEHTLPSTQVIGYQRKDLMKLSIVDPLLWSAEQPNLYTLVLSLYDQSAKLRDVRSHKIGFRDIAVNAETGELLVNGKAIKLKGIIFQEHSPQHGHAVTDKELESDLKLMKRLNFNAVRLVRPQKALFYELCDEYGIYVFDEANIETGDIAGRIIDDNRWFNPMMDRVVRMVERDKNHASVVAWSLGNDSSVGRFHAAAASWLKDYDPLRLIHYEAAQGLPRHPKYVPPQPQWYLDKYGEAKLDRNVLANPNDPAFVDVIGRRYLSISELEKIAKYDHLQRPIVLSQYSHAMGNSLGSLNDVWQIIHKNARLAGGFIWDWRDKGLIKTLKRKSAEDIEYLAYGGDFGQANSEGSYAQSGLVDAKGKPGPKAWEAKYVFQPFIIENSNASKGKIKVTSRLNNLNASAFQLRWQVLQGSTPIQTGEQVVDIDPQAQENIRLDLKNIPRTPGKHYYLRVGIHTKNDLPWAPSGYEVAKAQFSLPHVKEKPATLEGLAAVDVANKGGIIQYSNNLFSMRFNKATGNIEAYEYTGQSILRSPMVENFWRPQTDKDRLGWKSHEVSKIWRDMPKNLKVGIVQTQAIRPGKHRLTVSKTYENTVDIRTEYTIYGNGRIDVDMRFKADVFLPPLLRLGFQLGLDKQFSFMSYHGRGPWENYRDRYMASEFGTYSGPVESFLYSYMIPQEHGNRSEVSWLSFKSESNITVMIRGDEPMNVSAWPWSQAALDKAMHPHELKAQGFYTVNLDLAQTGLGGGSSWSKSASPLEKHQLQPGRLRHSFSIVPE